MYMANLVSLLFVLNWIRRPSSVTDVSKAQEGRRRIRAYHEAHVCVFLATADPNFRDVFARVDGHKHPSDARRVFVERHVVLFSIVVGADEHGMRGSADRLARHPRCVAGYRVFVVFVWFCRWVFCWGCSPV